METLGVVWAVKHFRSYILGYPCTVYTDHAACLSLLNSRHPSTKLARWALTIQEMNLTIKHRSGKKNLNADALSRNPTGERTSVSSLVVTNSDSSMEDGCIQDIEKRFGEIREQQRDDLELLHVIKYLENGELPEDERISKSIHCCFIPIRRRTLGCRPLSITSA